MRLDPKNMKVALVAKMPVSDLGEPFVACGSVWAPNFADNVIYRINEK
jgi:hypothetical protein